MWVCVIVVLTQNSVWGAEVWLCDYLFSSGKQTPIDSPSEITLREEGVDGWNDVGKVPFEPFLATPRLLIDRNGRVVERSSGKMVGELRFSDANDRMPLSFEVRGKGYATEAKYAMLKFYFSQLNRSQSEAWIRPSNRASWLLHIKLGFVAQSKPDGTDRPIVLILTKKGFEEVERKWRKSNDPIEFFQPFKRLKVVKSQKFKDSGLALQSLENKLYEILEVRRQTASTLNGKEEAKKEVEKINTRVALLSAQHRHALQQAKTPEQTRQANQEYYLALRKIQQRGAALHLLDLLLKGDLRTMITQDNAVGLQKRLLQISQKGLSKDLQHGERDVARKLLSVLKPHLLPDKVFVREGEPLKPE